MSRSIKENLRHFSEQERIDMRFLLEAAQADIADLRTKFATLLAKIDADSGDTGGDNDYATSAALATQEFLP